MFCTLLFSLNIFWGSQKHKNFFYTSLLYHLWHKTSFFSICTIFRGIWEAKGDPEGGQCHPPNKLRCCPVFQLTEHCLGTTFDLKCKHPHLLSQGWGVKIWCHQSQEWRVNHNDSGPQDRSEARSFPNRQPLSGHQAPWDTHGPSRFSSRT